MENRSEKSREASPRTNEFGKKRRRLLMCAGLAAAFSFSCDGVFNRKDSKDVDTGDTSVMVDSGHDSSDTGVDSGDTHTGQVDTNGDTGSTDPNLYCESWDCDWTEYDLETDEYTDKEWSGELCEGDDNKPIGMEWEANECDAVPSEVAYDNPDKTIAELVDQGQGDHYEADLCTGEIEEGDDAGQCYAWSPDSKNNKSDQ